jgi:hypothetical protein
MNTAEAAAYLGITKHRLHYLCRIGRGPVRKLNRSHVYVYTQRSLDEYKAALARRQKLDLLDTTAAATYCETTIQYMARLRFEKLGPDYIKEQGRVWYTRAALDAWNGPRKRHSATKARRLEEQAAKLLAAANHLKSLTRPAQAVHTEAFE